MSRERFIQTCHPVVFPVPTALSPLQDIDIHPQTLSSEPNYTLRVLRSIFQLVRSRITRRSDSCAVASTKGQPWSGESCPRQKWHMPHGHPMIPEKGPLGRRRSTPYQIVCAFEEESKLGKRGNHYQDARRREIGMDTRNGMSTNN